MEFEEMIKIWDTQNQQPLFAIDEGALLRRIQTKGRKAKRVANMNEIGLTLIFSFTAIILLIADRDSFFSYLYAGMSLLIAVYVWIGRQKRKKIEKQFDRTLLGELEQAIFNVENEINRSQNVFWWMLLPFGLPSLLNMAYSGVETWQWVVIPASLILAYIVVRWGLKKQLLPRKRELEGLREVLVE